MRKAHLFLALAILCIATFGGLIAEAQGDNTESLKAVLGSDAAAWNITGEHAVVAEKGTPTLVPKGSLTLEGKTRYGAPTEYLITFRMRPTDIRASMNVSVGCTDLPDGGKQAFSAYALADKGTGYLTYGCSATPEIAKAIDGTLYLQAFTDQSWPEELRKRLEAQMAMAPQIDDMLCTLRLVMTDKQYSAWVNGRFIGRMPVTASSHASGTVSIAMSGSTALVSFSAVPSRETIDRFETLDLGGFVNTFALINGQRVATLPALKDSKLDGVLFRYPGKDSKGNDHLDLGPSWTRFGDVQGYLFANMGMFGGRWVAADHIDPSRFCMYVPYGQYKALHLIAAADGEKDSVPVITAQFYRPDAGQPMNFAGKVPIFSAKSSGVTAFPVKLANGKTGKLYHVIVPLDPDTIAWFSNFQRMGLELTKAVQPYRTYPDPMEFSWHSAGLPSGVHIYAATLEKASVDVDPQPDAPAHVWTAPDAPSYTINLRNNTGIATVAQLTITTASYDGKDTTRQMQRVALPSDSVTVPVHVKLAPTRYGLQYVRISCAAGGDNFTYERNFAYLHPDTRERGDWAEGKGPIFGSWNWAGGHNIPGQPKNEPDLITELKIMAQAGYEETLVSFNKDLKNPEALALASKLKFATRAFDTGVMYYNFFAGKTKFDMTNPEATEKGLIAELKELKYDNPTLYQEPAYMTFFPEVQVGNRLTMGIFPHHYNAPDYKFKKAEQAYYDNSVKMFVFAARAVRKEWPDVKILFPYGDPMNTAVFLEKSPETREFIDGIGLDMPNFERLPEQQVNQVTLNRLYPILKDVKKYQPNPFLIMVEGTCVSSLDVASGDKFQADIVARDFLTLIGYGVNNHESSNPIFDCGNYYGEDHYGGGNCTVWPKAMPKLAFTTTATLTRHLNRANFIKYVPTGSTSVYCQQYKHYKTGELVYTFWTIRGKRPVSVKVPAGATLEVYDQNDNPTELKEKDGVVTFTIDDSPVYLRGMTGDAEITLGESDHSDAKLAAINTKLGNLGDSSWKLVAKRDLPYEDTNHLQIERFLGNMSSKNVAAPKAQGGKALAVHLGEQEIDRGVMPYYTTLEPQKPVTIPGKAKGLGIWVKASSDWGRIVYSLRDAKGERWINVGVKEDWNSDDIRCWSAFCFDGWRYLTFELPSNAPYDLYREPGSFNWGSYDGDGVVDLPLQLEKVIIERRPKVVYGADLVPANTDDVLLGDIYAEYTAEVNKTNEAIRLSKLRMPEPVGLPNLPNPIADIEKAGVGTPTTVLSVDDKLQWCDGTRCHVNFTPVDGALSYNVWISHYVDGRGAVKLGDRWSQSGMVIEGLHENTDYYVFVTYLDKDGKLSKPSKALQFKMKNKLAGIFPAEDE